jgi:hypothetical protein
VLRGDLVLVLALVFVLGFLKAGGLACRKEVCTKLECGLSSAVEADRYGICVEVV